MYTWRLVFGEFLGLLSRILLSSTVESDPQLKGLERQFETLGSVSYLNPLWDFLIVGVGVEPLD